MRGSSLLAGGVALALALACGGPVDVGSASAPTASPAPTAAPKTIASISDAFKAEGDSPTGTFSDVHGRLAGKLGPGTVNEYGVTYWAAAEGTDCRILWISPQNDGNIGTWALESHGCDDL